MVSRRGRRRRGRESDARLRELRRAAGLTQDELAAGRFTKQYVSQIERGATVPSERRSTGSRSGSASSPASSARGSAPPRSRGFEQTSSRRRGAPARRAPLPRGTRDFAPLRRSLPPRRHASWSGRPPRRGVVARPARARHRGGRGARRGAGGDDGRAGRGRLPHGDLLLHDLGDLRGAGRVRDERSSCSTPPRSRTTGCASTSTSGARAATAASATGRPRARTSSARSSSATRSATPAAAPR